MQHFVDKASIASAVRSTGTCAPSGPIVLGVTLALQLLQGGPSVLPPRRGGPRAQQLNARYNAGCQTSSKLSDSVTERSWPHDNIRALPGAIQRPDRTSSRRPRSDAVRLLELTPARDWAKMTRGETVELPAH